ncbi:MAG: TraM recognition domain-containing protein, partial [Sulfurovum sp.]|nr:TraM recognition domain-containing protein [Sulfurovaceae bacterium]
IIEENFYDVEKGLWLGVAWDLDDTDTPPFLLYLPFKNLHNHLEVFGTSGYGKSRLMAVILRQFIHFDWSLFAIDPKGGDGQEIPHWIYDFAAEAGLQHLVTRIMPTYPSLSDKGNPIFSMSDVEIASLCSSLVVSGSGSQSSDEQFFSGQVYRITYAILAATSYLESAISPDGREINAKVIEEVKKYLEFRDNKSFGKGYEDKIIEYPDIAQISTNNKKDMETKYSLSPFTRTLITFRELAYYSMFDNLKYLHKIVEDTPIPILKHNKERANEITAMKEVAIRAISELTSMDKNFYEKTGTSLSVLLSQLAYGPVGSVLCDVKINPLVKRARDNQGMIVIFQPAPMRFEKVSEILIKVYVKMWLSLFGTVGVSGRGIKKRVVMAIDEAKPMMFPGVEEIYNKARQLGMTIMALFQSKSDMKYKLGETLTDITQDNTATSITMKQVSLTSRIECAGSFGTTKRASNIQMTEMDGGGRSTVVYEESEVVSAKDIDNLQIAEGYVQHYGRQYYVKFPYQRDPMPVNAVMPKLESETAYEFISQVEAILLSEKKNILDINGQIAEKKLESETDENKK